MPTISLCMIVKDEIERLPELLESVVENAVFDEIVIVDTGSTDGTLEVVEEWADVWEQVEWTGFSDARNRSIDLASGDFVFILDADDRVEDVESWKIIRGIVEREEDLEAIRVKIVNKLPEGQMAQGNWLWQIRLFKNVEGFRYKGKVHNQIEEPIYENARVRLAPVVVKANFKISHIGYALDQADSIKKYKTRFPLLLEEIDSRDNPRWREYFRFQYANALFMTRDVDEALWWIRQLDYKHLRKWNQFSASIMGFHGCCMVADYEGANEFAGKMLDIWPKEPISFVMKGLGLMAQAQWESALDFLETAIHMVDQELYEFRYNVDADHVCAAAGECAMAAGKLGEAKFLFQRHLAAFPENERVADLEKAIVKKDQTKLETLETAD